MSSFSLSLFQPALDVFDDLSHAFQHFRKALTVDRRLDTKQELVAEPTKKIAPQLNFERESGILTHQKLLTEDIARECIVHLVECIRAWPLGTSELHFDNDGPEATSNHRVTGTIEGKGFYIDLALVPLTAMFLFTDFERYFSIGQEAIARGFIKPAAKALANTLLDDVRKRLYPGSQLVLASRAPFFERGADNEEDRCTIIARYQRLTLRITTFRSDATPTLRCHVDLVCGFSWIEPFALSPEGAD